MPAPLYNAHGHSIPDPADGYMDDEDINDAIDGINDIPTGERVAFFNAVRVHHDHQHFVTDPDDVFMQIGRDGSIKLQAVPMDTSSLTPYDGFEFVS
jgi:hypothetical protein